MGALVFKGVGFSEGAVPDGEVGSLRGKVGVEVFGHAITHFSDAYPADFEGLRGVGHFC